LSEFVIKLTKICNNLGKSVYTTSGVFSEILMTKPKFLSLKLNENSSDSSFTKSFKQNSDSLKINYSALY